MLLVLTVTPLQLYFAKRIIRDYYTNEYCLLNLAAHTSPRLRRYYEQVSAGATQSEYLVLDGSALANLKKVDKVLALLGKLSIEKILLSSIDNVFAQYIVKKIQAPEFCTFDDGTVNIIQAGVYHNQPSHRLLRRIAYWLLRGRRNLNWMKDNTRRHFTMFEGVENIVDRSRLQFVPLFEAFGVGRGRGSGEAVRVFLGGPHSDAYWASVRLIAPDYYLPHPMEKPGEGIANRVVTDLIAEEFIEKLLDDYREIEIFACASTALLNLRGSRIRRFVIDLQEGNRAWQAQYNSLASQLGCRIVPQSRLGDFVRDRAANLSAIEWPV